MSKRGRGDGSIRQRKDGSWEGRLRYLNPITGFAERASFYGRTRGEVVALLDDGRRRLRGRKQPRDESIVLSDFLELWLDDVVKPTKRPWTYRTYRSIAEHHLIPTRLGRMQLRDLRAVQIQHVLVAKAKVPTRTQQLALIVLRGALQQAVAWGFLAENPAAGIAGPRIVRPEQRALSEAQVRAFLAAAAGDRLCALYAIAIDTGMRQGELLALRWTDIDEAGAAVRVVRTLDVRTGTAGPTKTRSSKRRVALGRPALAVLRAHRARMDAEGHRSALVFPSTTGAPLSPSNVRIRSFLPIQKAAGIEPPVRFHDLRHTAATLMFEAGAPAKAVSERLGHATIAITMDTYQHVSETMQHELAERIGLVWSGSIGGKVGGRTRPERSGNKKRASRNR